MIIKNGVVFDENCQFVKKDLYVEDGHFVTLQKLRSHECLDAKGQYVIPGLIDVHTHGAMGFDFSNSGLEDLIKIAQYEKSIGVTSFCPTAMTIPFQSLYSLCKIISSPLPDTCGNIPGIHLEGPFLNSLRKGAQDSTNMIPVSEELIDQLLAAFPTSVSLVTIAPELDGGLSFIEKYKDRFTISCGHSDCDYDIAMQAFQAGATHVTHLFNGMRPFHHRDPGIFGAAFDSPNVMVELICDGYHLHDSVIRNCFQTFTSDRIVLISDSMSATGMCDGIYRLGGQTVYVKEKKATLESGNLAGSSTNLFDCMLHCVALGIPLPVAIKAATHNPARSIGIFDQVGSLSPGKKADFLFLDSQLHLTFVSE